MVTSNAFFIRHQVFNLGEYRRKILPSYTNADFFSSDNEEGNRLRERVCTEALEDVLRQIFV